MFFAEYSLLAMFHTYPASKCTTQNMYTRVCAGVVVIVSLRTVNNKGIALFAREQSVVMYHSNIDDNSTCESMTKYNITIT